MLGERQLARPRIRFSLGDPLGGDFRWSAEANDGGSLGTNGIEDSLKLLFSFGRRDDEEALAPGLTLKLDECSQGRHPVLCVQPRPTSRQLLGLDRAERHVVDC